MTPLNNTRSDKDYIVLELSAINTLPSNLCRHTFHLRVESILPLDPLIAHSFKPPQPKTVLSDPKNSFTSCKFVLSPSFMVTELIKKATDIYFSYGPASMFGYGKEETQNIILGLEGSLLDLEELDLEELDSTILTLKVENGYNQCDLIAVSEGEQLTITFNTKIVDIRFIGKIQ